MRLTNSVNNPSRTMYRLRVRYLLAGLFCFLFAGLAMAEVVYVIDHLRLGVRANPDPAESPVAVVTTGDELTVLGREGDYIRIRTGDGTEGWVSNAYVSDEQPAVLKLQQLRKENSRIEAQAGELREALAESNDNRKAMESRLSELTAENTLLQQQLGAFTGSGVMQKYAWVFQGLLLVAIFLGGFYLGMTRYKHRVRERMGGMEI